jgi:uncharacterized protein
MMIPPLAPRAAALIALGLQPHPEGGHYRELYRSPRRVQPDDGRTARAALTTISFLLAAGQHGRWHRLRSDEVWQFLEGDPLELFIVDAGLTHCQSHVLGSADGTSAPQHIVPAGCWQAAQPTGAFALVGCTVSPGVDFADFALLADCPAETAALCQRFPDVAALL